MHPELLRAVMLERQQRFQHPAEFPEHQFHVSRRPQRPTHTLLSRARARVGNVLVSVGSRLAAVGPPGSELRGEAGDTQSLGGRQAVVR
jgi:hypothetical protein